MLTDTSIRLLKPDCSKIKKLHDGGRNGLVILCHPTGRKVFVLRYTHPITKKEQTLTIGQYPHISLKVARERAAEARSLRSLGIDPRESEKRLREADLGAARDSFEVVGYEWIKVRGARWSDSYRHKIKTMLERHLFSAIGQKPITQIDAVLLLSLLRPVEESGKSDLAHTLLQQASAIFRFAISIGKSSIDPAASLRGALMPHKGSNFAAITTPTDFAELLRAIDSYKGEFITKAALEFTMLTLQRSQSVRFAKWDQIDWDSRLWRIPASTMKMGEDHIVPLSTQALANLEKLQPLTLHTGYLFPSLFGSHKPISENTMLYALIRLGYRKRMTVHGFRTTASTLLNENGHNPDVIEAALAHVKGDVRSIYNRAKYLPERIKLYQWWADYVDNLRQCNNSTT